MLVSTLPEVLGATKVGADAPLPRITLLAVRVVRLVPPLATASVPVKALTTLEATLTKSEPFHAQTALSPVINVTPVVGPAPTSLTDCAVPLITTYTLLAAGAVIVSKLAGVPVQLMTMYWEDPVAPAPAETKVDPFVTDRVTAVCVPLMVCTPATAESRNVVM